MLHESSNDWTPVNSNSDYFHVYVPLKYESNYLNRLPTEESVIEYGALSRKESLNVDESNSSPDSLETIKSEYTYVAKTDKILQKSICDPIKWN